MTSQEFHEKYIPLGGAAYRVALYILESQEDAEDAVQDMYIKLWNARDSLDTVRNPKSYCICLIRNICIDRIRKTARVTSVELQENIPDTATSDNAAIGKETVARVARAISNLPDGQRKVLELKAFEDLTNDEISSRTGMSGLTVRVLLSQARKTLRKYYGPER